MKEIGNSVTKTTVDVMEINVIFIKQVKEKEIEFRKIRGDNG